MTDSGLTLPLHSTKCENCGMILVPATVIADTPEVPSFLVGQTAWGSLASTLPGRSIWQDSVGKGTYEHTYQRCRAARRLRLNDIPDDAA